MGEGHLVAMGLCFVHGGLFSFDPETVPSVLIDPRTNRPPAAGDAEAIGRAVREPVCDDCLAVINPQRVAGGLPPIEHGRRL